MNRMFRERPGCHLGNQPRDGMGTESHFWMTRQEDSHENFFLDPVQERGQVRELCGQCRERAPLAHGQVFTPVETCM